MGVSAPKTREAAGVLVYRWTGLAGSCEFLLLRNARRKEWGFPKGHVDFTDSDILATAVRELKEETGLSDVLLHTGFRLTIQYPLPSGETKVVTYFLARHEGGKVCLSPEHDAQEWATTTQTVSMLAHDSLQGVLSSAMRFLEGRREISHLL